MFKRNSPKAHSESVKEYQSKAYFPMVSIRFRKIPPKEFLYPAAEWAAQEMGITIAKFCMIAVEEKLKRDGFLLESE